MWRIKELSFLSFISITTIDYLAAEVTIAQGKVVGKVNADGSVFEYLGIPYASTDKTTRFQAPGPAPKWNGIFKAVKDGPVCIQKSLFGIQGDENCLNLNIYVPTQSKGPFPVMVFIPGGAFVLGDNGKIIYGPEFLTKHNIILVIINYRLGAFGFLCLGIKEAPGNAGLKDQVAALRWVKKNIAAFGGDPDNITLFGESAGGTSTSLMISSPVTDGLFNKAIVQSGASSSNWGINRDPVWSASVVAKSFGYKTRDPLELYKLFSKMSTEAIIFANFSKPWDKYFDTHLVYLPCVEKSIPGVEAVVTDIPYNMMKKLKKEVKVIYGSNNREGLFLVNAETDESLDERNYSYLFGSDLIFQNNIEKNTVNDEIKQFYFGSDRIEKKNIIKLSDIYTHLYFEMPEIFETELLLEQNITVYNYYFQYSGYRNVLKYISGFANIDGACHADDLFYLYNSVIWPFWITKSDQIVIDTMTKMWTNFAKYGNPTPEISQTLPVIWSPSEKKHLKFLYIDKVLTKGDMPNKGAYKLWKKVYLKHRKLIM